MSLIRFTLAAALAVVACAALPTSVSATYNWGPKVENPCVEASNGNPACPVARETTTFECFDLVVKDRVVQSNLCNGRGPRPQATFRNCPCSADEFEWEETDDKCPSPNAQCKTKKDKKTLVCKNISNSGREQVNESNCGNKPKPNVTDCPCKEKDDEFEFVPLVRECPAPADREVCPATIIATLFECRNVKTGAVVADSLCSGTKPANVLCPCKQSGGLVGDPIFSGFNGQTYQVHGMAGAVFNLFTSAQVQVNSRFELFATGRDQAAIDALKAADASLPSTSIWTHSGTYLSEISVQTAEGGRLFVKAGKFEQGIVECSVSGLAANATLAVGETYALSKDATQFVKRVSASSVQVQTSAVSLTLVNSDLFFNIEEASLPIGTKVSQVGGLLGASANPTFKQWKATEVMALLVAMPLDTSDLHHAHTTDEMFANEFIANKFVSAL